MLCVTKVTGVKGYRDEHLVPIDYLLHSSVPGNKFNRLYVLNGSCKFPVKVGSRTGTATLGYAFNYNIFSVIANSPPAITAGSDASSQAAKKKKKHAMVSTIRYHYKK